LTMKHAGCQDQTDFLSSVETVYMADHRTVSHPGLGGAAGLDTPRPRISLLNSSVDSSSLLGDVHSASCSPGVLALLDGRGGLPLLLLWSRSLAPCAEVFLLEPQLGVRRRSENACEEGLLNEPGLLSASPEGGKWTANIHKRFLSVECVRCQTARPFTLKTSF
jgi:hypothetical protein